MKKVAFVSLGCPKNLVDTEHMLGALLFGHEEIKRLCAFQKEIVAAAGKEKREVSLFKID